MKTTINKDFFEKWKDKKVVMWCKEKKYAQEFCRILDKYGLVWNSGNNYPTKDLWDIFDINTCYEFNANCYGQLDCFKEENYTILNFEDYILHGESIFIKYFHDDIPKIEKIFKGDWIDLRVDSIKVLNGEKVDYNKWESMNLYKGDIVKIGLGVAIQLPDGYEAYLVPRSSTFKKWGFLQTNSIGIIDNSYCGDDDEWMVEFICMKDTVLKRFDRTNQFRIMKNQCTLNIEEVDHLNNANRGGYGSTDIK